MFENVTGVCQFSFYIIDWDSLQVIGRLPYGYVESDYFDVKVEHILKIIVSGWDLVYPGPP